VIWQRPILYVRWLRTYSSWMMCMASKLTAKILAGYKYELFFKGVCSTTWNPNISILLTNPVYIWQRIPSGQIYSSTKDGLKLYRENYSHSCYVLETADELQTRLDWKKPMQLYFRKIICNGNTYMYDNLYPIWLVIALITSPVQVWLLILYINVCLLQKWGLLGHGSW